MKQEYEIDQWIKKPDQFDKFIQTCRTSDNPPKKLLFASSFGNRRPRPNWERILNSAIEYQSELEKLSLTQQYFPHQCLHLLKDFHKLKTLTLYWSGLGKNKFFSELPSSIEKLDLSRSNAVLNHTPHQLSKMLSRLTNLKSLNLGETSIDNFPALTKPNTSLTKLELYHHTWGRENETLDATDLESIIKSFPNLKYLNINGCNGFDADNPKCIQLIKQLAEIDGFQLYANGNILDIFVAHKSKAALRSIFQWPESTIDEVVSKNPQLTAKLIDPDVLQVIEKIGIRSNHLSAMLCDNPKKFKFLTDKYCIRLLERGFSSYKRISELYDRHSGSLKAIINFEALEILIENKCSFEKLVQLFERKPEYVKEMIGFNSSYHKVKKMFEAEIDMLIAADDGTGATLKRLQKQNPEVDTFIISNYDANFKLTGEDFDSIYQSFPNLKRLIINSGVEFIPLTEKTKTTHQLAKDTIESLIRNNLDDSLLTVYLPYSSVIMRYRERATALIFYENERGISREHLLAIEDDQPELFKDLVSFNLHRLIKFSGISFEYAVEHLKNDRDSFLELSQSCAAQLIESNFVSYDDIEYIFFNDKSRFDALVNDNLEIIMTNYNVSWESLNQIYDKGADLIDDLIAYKSELNIGEKENCKKMQDKVQNILRCQIIDEANESVAMSNTKALSTEDNRYENAASKNKSEDAIEQNLQALELQPTSDPNVRQKDKQMLPFVNARLHFFYGLNKKSVPCAFKKEQAYLAAKWFLSIVEEFMHKSMGDVGQDSKVNLTFDQKDTFIEHMANSLWFRLENDVSLSINGQSPLYVYWNDDYVSNALKAANIDVDNSKDLLLIAFIGQNNVTSYQKGTSEVGDCDEYLDKVSSNKFRINI